MASTSIVTCSYDPTTCALKVSLGGTPHFKYSFNKGGAVNGIYDLQIVRDQNLIAKPYRNETTDRVLQWTYWNNRYLAAECKEGNMDRHANATMEGSFGQRATCDSVSSPFPNDPNFNARILVFRSVLTHWFYSTLDVYGRPHFETTSTYEVLDDGSLKLTREVLRGPWLVSGVYETDERKKDSLPVFHTEKHTMDCVHLWHKSMTSYLEAWCPFEADVVGSTRYAHGTVSTSGYKFKWSSSDVGGWVMACGNEQAVAVVFGKTGKVTGTIHMVFNRLTVEQKGAVEARLNILLPGVEFSWPDNATLKQVLIFVPGAPDNVAARANDLVRHVPPPTLDTSTKSYQGAFHVMMPKTPSP